MSDSDSSSTTAVGISSCMSGQFEPLPNDSSDGTNRWSFCYNLSSNKINLNVTLDSPLLLTSPAVQVLTSELSDDDVTQLINWLFVVRSTMEKQAKSDPDGS